MGLLNLFKKKEKPELITEYDLLKAEELENKIDIIIKQNKAIELLLQGIYITLGVDNEKYHEVVKIIEKEINEEVK